MALLMKSPRFGDLVWTPSRKVWLDLLRIVTHTKTASGKSFNSIIWTLLELLGSCLTP